MEKEPYLGPLIEGKDIIIPANTHKHEGCKIQEIWEYKIWLA